MRIIFLCSEFPPDKHGGIGIFVKNLSENLVLKGHQVAVIGYSDRRPNFSGVENKVSFKTFKRFPKWLNIRFGNYFFPFKDIFERVYISYKLLQFSKKFIPEIIESYDWSGPLIFKPTIPLVVRLHGANTALRYEEKKRVSRFLYLLERHNIKLADQLIAVSDYIGKMTLTSLKLVDKKFEVIYNGFDSKIFYPEKNVVKNGKTLLFVGRMDERKGVLELMHLLNELIIIDETYKLIIIGPEIESLKLKMISILNQDSINRIKFIGPVHHQKLREYYNSGTALIMPSRAEAFGLTAIEAMACGLVVFMSNKGNAKEIISNEKEGVLIDFNKPVNAAKKIDEILRDTDVVKRISQNGNKKAYRLFDNIILLEKNINIYKKVIDEF